MLKTLSLTSDDAAEGGPAADPHTGEIADDSEQKMRRALEQLSNQRPLPGDADPTAAPVFRETGHGRDQGGGFREPNSFRDQGGRHELGHGAARRHRFVKDGEVPVVHMAPPRGREVAAPRADTPPPSLQPLLDQERLARDRAERSLAEVQAQLRVLQTKLAHTDMALQDATTLAAARLVQLGELQGQLQAALAVPPARPPLLRAPSADPAAGALPRKVGRPRTRPLIEKEPEPVKWWLQPAPKSRRRDTEPSSSTAFDWAIETGDG